MRRIFLFFIFASILSIQLALACPEEKELAHLVKKSLFDFLRNPASSALGENEVRDLIELFVGERFLGADCHDLTGSYSRQPVIALLEIAKGIPETAIPRCSDGTIYGECSLGGPNFCYSGKLRIMCYGPDMLPGNEDDCGCPRHYEVCGADGTCQPHAIMCTRNDDCGPNVYSNLPECNGSLVVDQYMYWVCNQPGTIQSSCEFHIEEKIIQDCSPGECVEGLCI